VKSIAHGEERPSVLPNPTRNPENNGHYGTLEGVLQSQPPFAIPMELERAAVNGGPGCIHRLIVHHLRTVRPHPTDHHLNVVPLVSLH
jgi:hypothetical protein